jgi:hypothetical protein
MKTKLDLDLIAVMDRVTTENPEMKPHEIRSEIACVFRAHAAKAGWNFREETWPVLRQAVEASINSTPEKEILGYIESLQQYCK